MSLQAVNRAVQAFFNYEADTTPALRATDVSSDFSAISLEIVFPAGEQFCCPSPECRFPGAFQFTEWDRLRELLQQEGIRPTGPIRFLVHVIFEPGCMFADIPADVGKPGATYYTNTALDLEDYVTDEANPYDPPRTCL
jgi:hypothetical protein